MIDEGLGDVPPLLFLALRFVLVAVPLVFFVPRPKAGWRTVVAVGTFMSLGQFSLLYIALDLGMPAGLASLVLQAQVIFTIVVDGGDEVGRALTHLSATAIASTAYTAIGASLIGYGIWNSLLAGVAAATISRRPGAATGPAAPSSPSSPVGIASPPS